MTAGKLADPPTTPPKLYGASGYLPMNTTGTFPGSLRTLADRLYKFPSKLAENEDDIDYADALRNAANRIEELEDAMDKIMGLSAGPNGGAEAKKIAMGVIRL